MTRPVPAIVQGILHLVAIYGVARICPPLLSNFVHDVVYPVLLRRPPGSSSWQFFFSHLFVFSFLPALIAGFVNSKWLPHKIARFVWTIPTTILIVVFVLSASAGNGLFVENDIQQAFYNFFGGNFVIPGEYHATRELLKDFLHNPDLLRGFEQFKITVPMYVGLAYSVGARLSPFVTTSVPPCPVAPSNPIDS